MRFCPALPALSYTGTVPDPSGYEGIKLSIQLVEYEAKPTHNRSDVTRLYPPPANRGYTKNEIVAAMVSLFVPANVKVVDASPAFKDLSLHRFDQLMLGGTDISLDVMLNGIYGANAHVSQADLPHDFPVYPIAGAVLPPNVQLYTKGGSYIELHLEDAFGGSAPLQPSEKDETYHVLYFAKITGDNPALTARLTRNITARNIQISGAPLPPGDGGMRIGYDYAIVRDFRVATWDDTDSPQTYIISRIDPENALNVTRIAQLFLIHTTSGRKDAAANGVEVTPQYWRNATEWFYVFYDNGKYEYMLSRTGQGDSLGRKPTEIERDILDYRMQEIFTNTLKLDITRHGCRLTFQDWADYVNSMHDIVTTAELQPYVGYVSVPDNIVTR